MNNICVRRGIIGRNHGALQVDSGPQRPAKLPGKREHATSQRFLHWLVLDYQYLTVKGRPG